MIENQKEEQRQIENIITNSKRQKTEGKIESFKIKDAEEPTTKNTNERKQAKSKKHGTDIDNHTNLNYWKGQTIAYIVDQLGLRNIRLDKSLITGRKTEYDGILDRKVTTKVKKLTNNELIGILLGGAKTV